MARSLRTYLSRATFGLPAPIALDDAVRQILILHRQDGGSTFNLYFGDQSGEKLYAVSAFPQRSRIVQGREIRPQILTAFLAANRDLLADPRCCVGTWYNQEEGLTYLDISAALSNKRKAIRLAKRYNQIGIFDLRRSEVIETGGSGLPPADMPPLDRRLPILTRTEDS